jgi:hypothetical protein
LLNRHDTEASELALDACIDRLVSGGDWQSALPADREARDELLGLLAVARKLAHVASLQRRPAPEVKRRVWRRISASPDFAPNPGFFRRLSAFRVLYSPPARPNVMERVLLARVPALPPLVVRFAEAS